MELFLDFHIILYIPEQVPASLVMGTNYSDRCCVVMDVLVENAVISHNYQSSVVALIESSFRTKPHILLGQH